MTLFITAPPSLKALRQYTCDVLFTEFLGVSFQILWNNVANVTISCSGAPGQILMPDIFFPKAELAWGDPKSLPSQPLRYWDIREMPVYPQLEQPLLPCIYGDDCPQGRYLIDKIYLPVDLLGSAFFMLSRYEEWITPGKDGHQRFPAKASLAFQEGFLDRPIIDEYTELLWQTMVFLWPRMVRKSRQAKNFITCDVDRPYYPYVKSRQQTLKVMGGDLFKRLSPRLARERWSNYQFVKHGSYQQDPYWQNLYWIMDVNEKAGTELAFYLIPAQRHAFDGWYHLNEPVIRNLIKAIASRGHEIGLHASYCSYNDYAQLTSEMRLLQKSLLQQDINQSIKGGRQHYLRWDVLSSPAYWDNAGLQYDSTLGFADAAGFRCGTSHDYPMVDLSRKCKLKLRQRPLILMECSVISAEYMGFGFTNHALDYMQTLKRRCHNYGGVFTLLWHNSHLSNIYAKKFYEELIS